MGILVFDNLRHAPFLRAYCILFMILIVEKSE